MDVSPTDSTKIFKKYTLLLFLIIISSLLVSSSAGQLKVYPLADEYFQKIYVLEQNANRYFMTVSCKEQNALSVSISPQRQLEQNPRFNIYGSQKKPRMGLSTYTFLKQCQVNITVNTSHLISFRRSQNQEPFFTISSVNFNNFHNIVSVVDPSTKWGLGQRFQRNFRVIDGQWTIWNRDKPWKIDRGQPGLSDQTYGHQPIYLARNSITKLHHLVYYKNTFGMLVDAKNNVNDLTYHTTGGPVHFIIMVGGKDPQQLLQKYHQYIGPSLIPPFWSIGYHQCRWGYKTVGVLEDVLMKFKQNDLPVDTIWSDLDYMDKKMIFTVNKNTHGGQKLNRMMRDFDIHFVPLIDAGVSIYDKTAMDMGKKLDVFLRNPKNQHQYYTGEVWPGAVHFVDYLHPKANQFWTKQLQRLYDQVQFSGIWLDMNEPSNFRGNQAVFEPFRIQKNQNINQMTMNVQIPHYTQLKNPLKHWQVHAYYGHMSIVHTNSFFKSIGKRPFIISRSNSVGSGYFGGHWTGDNVANFQFLRASINGNFLYQIFGMQMVGADICGFHENANEQLCARWYQLGVFYPFSRNHNDISNRDQQPYSFGQKLLTTSRLSLKTKYALLKHMYTVMVSKKGKGSYFRPLNFQFPSDQNVYEQQNIQTQFLIGRSLMSAPVVHPGATQRRVYFPGVGEVWYQFTIDSKTGKVNTDIKSYHGNTSSIVNNNLPSAPITFLRSGFALLTNKPQNRARSLNQNYHLFAALNNNQASTKIMAIKDYDHEPHLSACIQSGCFIELKLKKKEGNVFEMEWKYSGERSEIRSDFSIDSIVVISGNDKWISNIQTKINSLQGKSEITMTQG